MSVQFPTPGPPPGRPDEEAPPAPADGPDVFAHDTEDQSAAGDADEHAPAATAHTGNHDVDRVLDSLDTLAQKPVDEHVAVFEHAHEQLRGALDGPRLPRP